MKKETKMIVGTVVFIGALVGVGSFMMKKDAGQPEAADSSWQASLIKSHSPRQGSDMAKVKIVEFLDPECESCAAFHPMVKKLLQEYPQDLQLIVRYMLYHGNSKLAAIATEAAGRQGKYWEMQELLFSRPEWTHQATPQTEKFEAYAQELGLDLEKFRKDMQDPEIEKNVVSDYEEGPSVGVQGTPTFFVNGRQLQTLSYEALRARVEEELKVARSH